MTQDPDRPMECILHWPILPPTSWEKFVKHFKRYVIKYIWTKSNKTRKSWVMPQNLVSCGKSSIWIKFDVNRYLNVVGRTYFLFGCVIEHALKSWPLFNKVIFLNGNEWFNLLAYLATTVLHAPGLTRVVARLSTGSRWGVVCVYFLFGYHPTPRP